MFKRQLRRYGWTNRFEGIGRCRFVSSKGLMALCEVPAGPLADTRSVWPTPMILGHRSGGRIYVHPNALGHFARYSLPLIRKPFVLVSGDSDMEVSKRVVGGQVISRILANPNLIGWFSQNLAYSHPKTYAMPIGLDYHTVTLRRELHWGPSASPRAQEDMLHALRAMGRPLSEREATGYCNWHFQIDRGGRADAKAGIHPDAANFEPDRLPRWESWVHNTRHFFTLSPPGVGMDCHRTWEALLLGSVPIVAELPINKLFADLPVIVAKDWKDITPEFLQREKTRILNGTFDFAPLFIAYWRARLHGQSTRELRMKYQDFHALGPREIEEITAGWSG